MVSTATESAEYIESAAHFSWSETGYVGFDVEFSDLEEVPDSLGEGPDEPSGR